MYNFPINRGNESWKKINSQFLKGGFKWYNQWNPGYRNWYYLYYIREGEESCCKRISKYKRRIKVSNWLRNIEKFEEIHEKYENQIKLNKKGKKSFPG